MEILNDDEAEGLQPLGCGNFSPLYKQLVHLKVGQVLLVRYTEWRNVTTPYRTIKNVEKNYRRRFEYGRHPDGSGWIMRRLQ